MTTKQADPTKAETTKAWGAIVVTAITAGLVIWWLVLVGDRIGTKPVIENNSVVLDEWGRAKEILLIVVPLFTAMLAYWVGSAGKTEAKEAATEAKQEAVEAQGQLKAVLSESPEGTLAKAQAAYPGAFTAPNSE